MVRIHTFGHGTLEQRAFLGLASGAGLAEIIDIRSFPGSRRNPQFGRQEMTRWLPEAGIRYAWLGSLGGRRRPVPDSEHVALRNLSFRAYADHMETDEFASGVSALLERTGSFAVMCSETLWWRCHRRMLADHLTLIENVEVVHLMPGGRLVPHPPWDAARREGDRLVYDVGATPPLPDA
jgi:uncharacterized protein (DUF488 family)